MEVIDVVNTFDALPKTMAETDLGNSRHYILPAAYN